MERKEAKIVTAEEFNASVSRNIAFYRRLNGLSQAELGECIGYTNKSVSKWERGDGMPDVFTLFLISGVFGITVSELIGQTGKSKETVNRIKTGEKNEKAQAKARKKALERAKKNKRKG